MGIAAGKLNQRIIILIASEVRDSFGQSVQTYTALRTVWAQAMQGLGKEFIAAGNLDAQAKVAFQVRFASDILALGEEARIAWGGRLFDVQTMTGTRASGDLWLHCVSIGSYP